MDFERTKLPGVILVTPRIRGDHRGFFLEVYHVEKFAAGGIRASFTQDNHSMSVGGTLRGLHGQLRHPQGKLVRVIEGAIFDVAVDVRKHSPTFGEWFGIELSAENHRQLYVPPGLVHGFYVTGDRAQVEYKCTTLYDPGDEFGIMWNDPDLAIDWPVREPVLSAKDAALPPLSEVVDMLPDYPL